MNFNAQTHNIILKNKEDEVTPSKSISNMSRLKIASVHAKLQYLKTPIGDTLKNLYRLPVYDYTGSQKSEILLSL